MVKIRATDREAMCSGKAPLTWAKAVSIIRQSKEKARKRKPYHCLVCRHWHVGNPKLSNTKNMAGDKRRVWREDAERDVCARGEMW